MTDPLLPAVVILALAVVIQTVVIVAMLLPVSDSERENP